MQLTDPMVRDVGQHLLLGTLTLAGAAGSGSGGGFDACLEVVDVVVVAVFFLLYL